MTWRRYVTLLVVMALFAVGCGSASTTETGSGAGSPAAQGQPCDPTPSPDAGVDDSIDPDRRVEALVLHLTGIDELAVPAENEGEEIIYDDPNYGGVYGFAGGLVVAVVDCSQVDLDRIAEIGGGPDVVRLIEVPYSFEQMNAFRDTLAAQLEAGGIGLAVNIDSTLNGRTMTFRVSDRDLLPEGFGEGVPDDAYIIDTSAPSLAVEGLVVNVELMLGGRCRNSGQVEAGGASWSLADLAPFEWEGRSSILGDLEMNGATATFTSYSDDDTPQAFSVEMTTGGVTLSCRSWEQPQPVEPLTAVGPLECGDREVVEDRLSNDGQDPTELAMTYHPDVERVEPGDPLFWEAFDANGEVVVLMATGDDDVADWQIWTCG